MSRPASSAETRDIRLSRSFMAISRTLYGIPLRWMYNLKRRNEAEAFALKPPYILLSNHVNTFDPMILSVMHNRHIHWVAADTLFRNKYLRYALRRLVGSISKSKSRSDYYTIKQITGAVRRGGVVGLFPEGQRTWDGRSLPLFYATAKLVRMLKVPVVLCTLEGGYLSLPRWSDTRRKGELTIVYQRPLMPEEFAGMSTEQIHTLLTDRLYHDAYAVQKQRMTVFKSSRRAEYLEHVLYVCPSCGEVDSIHSHGNSVSCSACGFSAEIDVYGFFSPPAGPQKFESPADWNSWQHRELVGRAAAGEWDGQSNFFTGDAVEMFVGYRDERMKKLGAAEANMSIKGITAVTEEQSMLFSFDQIDSLAVAFQRNLEFYHKKSMYRLRFAPPRGSAYKYLSLYEAIAEAAHIREDRLLQESSEREKGAKL